MTKQEAGRLGGKATVAAHGKEHMSRLGKKGFRALCRKFRGNSRYDALKFLNGKGAVKARYTFSPHPSYDEIAEEMYEEMGLNSEPAKILF